MVLCEGPIRTWGVPFFSARAIGMADKGPTAPIMAVVICPLFLSSLTGPAESWTGFSYHAVLDPVCSVSILCLMFSNLIRKSSYFNSVAHAKFSAQNASSTDFIAALLWELVPAMALSHISLAELCWNVLLNMCIH